jgi:hypothetical protein
VSDIAARLLSTLRISGRRAVEMEPGAWAVLGRPDRRTRRLLSVDGDTVARLLAEQKLRLTTDGACVLADGVVAPPPPSLSIGAFIAAGRPRRSGAPAKGFLGLAVLARRGQGPLSLRQVQAGLRLIADAEREVSSKGLTMNWDAGPVDARKLGPRKGGQSLAAATATARLKRVRGLAGEKSWGLAWLACVEGASLQAIKAQMGLGQRALGVALSRALEDVANAYER